MLNFLAMLSDFTYSHTYTTHEKKPVHMNQSSLLPCIPPPHTPTHPPTPLTEHSCPFNVTWPSSCRSLPPHTHKSRQHIATRPPTWHELRHELRHEPRQRHQLRQARQGPDHQATSGNGGSPLSFHFARCALHVRKINYS